MPLGICSVEEFEDEIESLSEDKISNNVLGRGLGKKEVPAVLRKIISSEVIEGGSRKEVAQVFGISESSISAYIKGATSTSSYHKPDEGLKLHNNKIRTSLSNKARGVMNRSLMHITDDKLSIAKPGELAVVAKSMSGIVADMEDKIITSESHKTVITYRPRIKEEDSFDIIDVRE